MFHFFQNWIPLFIFNVRIRVETQISSNIIRLQYSSDNIILHANIWPFIRFRKFLFASRHIIRKTRTSIHWLQYIGVNDGCFSNVEYGKHSTIHLVHNDHARGTSVKGRKERENIAPEADSSDRDQAGLCATVHGVHRGRARDSLPRFSTFERPPCDTLYRNEWCTTAGNREQFQRMAESFRSAN